LKRTPGYARRTPGHQRPYRNRSSRLAHRNKDHHYRGSGPQIADLEDHCSFEKYGGDNSVLEALRCLLIGVAKNDAGNSRMVELERVATKAR
jgi:hypothetical protein